MPPPFFFIEIEKGIIAEIPILFITYKAVYNSEIFLWSMSNKHHSRLYNIS